MKNLIQETLLTALNESNPLTALLDAARKLKDAGATRKALFYTALDLREQYDFTDSNGPYDHLTDLLDVVWGYCSPEARLFPDELGDP